MKLHLSLLLTTEALRRRAPLERKFVNAEQCQATSPLSIDNGDLKCEGKICEVKCSEGFDLYQGTRKIKCKQHAKPGPSWPAPIIDWNKPPAECKTCSPNPTKSDDQFTTKCVLQSKAGQKIHKCITTCKNRKTVKFGQASPRKRVVHFCKCLKSDSMDRCHWKMGANYLDREGDGNHFDTWSCGTTGTTQAPTTGKPTTSKTTTTKRPTTTAPTTTKKTTTTTTSQPEVFNIPPGLTCPSDSVRGLNRFAQLSDADRIVGGEEAARNSWPWIVRLKIGAFLCGGTIIDNHKVVTAAHCCQGFTKPSVLPFVRAILGDHVVSESDFGEATHIATKVMQHPDYNSKTLENDICVITFNDLDLSNNEKAEPVCLPPPGDHPAHDTMCWTAGWGKMKSGRLAQELQEVDVGIIDNETCQTTDNKHDLKTDSMFCAGYLEGGKDACQGDSGGPLICNVDGKPVLYGVTSWGFGCAKKNSPGVWAKVTEYVGWIDSVSVP